MHHGRTETQNQHGDEITVAVLSTKYGEDKPGTKADVALQITSGGLGADFELPPAAARDLAARLIAAANSAESPDTAPSAIAPTPLSLPGERYAGTITRSDGSGHHIYIQTIQRDLLLNWRDAMTYAAERGLELPDRLEGALLFAAREEDEFDRGAYWTREQHAGNDAYAWCQDFAYGHQLSNHKDNELRVVLVRRVAI